MTPLHETSKPSVPMKRYTLTIAILGAFCGLAFAGPEPLPSGKEVLPTVAPAPPTCSFEGWYVGVHGGGLLQTGDTTIFAENIVTVPGGNTLDFTTPEDRRKHVDDTFGGFGGAHLGRNYMWRNFVFGIEVDANGSFFDNDVDAPTLHAGPVNHGIDVKAQTELTWFGTLRPRLGYAFGRFMPFLTGGLAVGGTEFDVDADIHYKFPGRDGEDIFVNTHRDRDDSQVGWTAGGGMDVCLNEHFTLNFTYLYMDMGDQRNNGGISNIPNPNTGNGNPPFVINFMGGVANTDYRYHVFQGGLSYKF